MSLKKVNIDGVDREAEAEVIVAYTKSQTDNKELNDTNGKLKTDIEELQGKHDALETENKQLKDDQEKAEKEFPKKVDEAVKSKLSLISNATKFGIDTLKDDGEILSDSEIKLAVINKAFPTSDGQFKDKEDAYIQASYDRAVEYLTNHKAQDEQNNLDMADLPDENKDQKVDSKKSRQKMIDEMTTNWQNEPEKK
jgi:FtsZ-binding cell division protein ZapB